MVITKKKQLLIAVAWICIVPPGVYFAFNYFPSKVMDWPSLLLYFFILIVTMAMPIHVSHMRISLERWITFIVFFQYGVFAELVFTQVAMILLLFNGKGKPPILHRFLVNSIMFTIVSNVSGLIFHAFSGGIGMMLDFHQLLILGSLYAISYMVLNSVLVQLYFTWMRAGILIWTNGTMWDYIVTMIVLPFSISLYYLNIHFGNKSILLIGIPLLLIIYIIRLYHRSDDLNAKLSSASVIGRELADRLGFEDVIRTFIVKLRDVVSYDQAYVFDLKSGKHLVPLMGSENGVVTKDVQNLVLRTPIFAGNGLDLDKTSIIETRKEAKMLKNFVFPQSVQSIMVAPIKRDQKTEGYLILTSHQKNMFQALEMQIVDVLTGYFAISLVKARLYEKTVEQSERCGLTKLYNFRYLDAKLDADILRYHEGDIHSLSAIMLDIDYFKKINDTYGHQSGNDLLCAFSKLLLPFVEQDATLARYGGEEFVFILPNKGKNESVALAEQIRKTVEEVRFRIVPDLSESRQPIDIGVTVSIGVASVPEDAEDVKSLLRNADRALYIGGKQAGRNRVGVFSREETGAVE